jgi:hypothetical protein
MSLRSAALVAKDAPVSAILSEGVFAAKFFMPDAKWWCWVLTKLHPRDAVSQASSLIPIFAENFELILVLCGCPCSAAS